MFGRVELSEIFDSITQHKLRNALTGFGIAWGIFILILMMGFGESFQTGVLSIFSGYAENLIYIIGGETSVSYKGNPTGEKVLFNENSLAQIKSHFSEVDNISPEANSPNSMKLTYDENYTMGNLVGVDKSYFRIKKLKLKEGRYFDEKDFSSIIPVCVMSVNLTNVLFKGKKKIIGEYVNIGGNYFKVIGVSKPSDMFDRSDRTSVLIPYKYFQSLYNSNTIDFFLLSLKPETDGHDFVEKLKVYIARINQYDPSDPKAIYTFNLSDQVAEFQSLFVGIRIFIWFVGFCILLTGVISVGNIMYVNINERTREIGIRKAIGATPADILYMILIESVILTSIAGLIGIISGYLFIQLVKYLISQFAGDNMFLNNVGINVPIIIGSLILLVFSGVLAGILPAIKASQIKPVIALNQEN